MKDCIRIFLTAVPPHEENGEDNGACQTPIDQRRLQPEIALPAAHGNLKQDESRDQKASAPKIQTGSSFRTHEASSRQELPDQNDAQDQERKIEQEGNVPVKSIVDRSHQYRVSELEDDQLTIKPGHGDQPRSTGEHQSRQDHCAHQKCSPAKAHHHASD